MRGFLSFVLINKEFYPTESLDHKSGLFYFTFIYILPKQLNWKNGCLVSISSRVGSVFRLKIARRMLVSRHSHKVGTHRFDSDSRNIQSISSMVEQHSDKVKVVGSSPALTTKSLLALMQSAPLLTGGLLVQVHHGEQIVRGYVGINVGLSRQRNGFDSHTNCKYIKGYGSQVASKTTGQSSILCWCAKIK